MKDRQYALDGSMTIYLSMIITGVLAFFLVLFTLGRVMLLKYGVREDLDIASYSVLAEYQEDWVREYGLYMVPLNRLESGLGFYMDRNSRHMFGDYDQFDLEVTDIGTLGDPAILMDEVRVFMKEREALSILEKILEMLTSLGDAEDMKETEAAVKNSEELLQIQEYYQELITAVYGVHADGSQSPYGVNLFLNYDHEIMPSEEGLIDVLDRILESAEEGEDYLEEITEEDLGILENALSAAQETVFLAQNAADYAGDIAAIMESVKEKGEEDTLKDLPFSADDMQEYAAIFQKDKDIVEILEEGLEQVLIELPEEDTDALLRAVYSLVVLVEYDRSVQLPYEVKPQSSGLDLRVLLALVQGYPADILDLAPTEAKDRKEAARWEPDTPFFALSDPLDFELSKEMTLLSLGEGIIDSYLLNEYFLGMFRSFGDTVAEKEGEKILNLRNEKMERRFFQNEIEYILAGHDNEYANVNEVRLKMIGMRAILNAAYLLSDPGKRSVLTGASELIGGILIPGLGNAIAFGALLTIWSLAESYEDYRILVSGGKVPLWKNEESWRTDLGLILEGTLDPSEEKKTEGLSYESYEEILLFFMSMDLRLARLQTLLELNHQYFSLEEAVARFDVSVAAYGDQTVTVEGSYGYVMP